MSGVLDGQPVSAAITNPAFIIKNADDTTPSKLGLANSDPISGASVANTQRELNAVDSFTGNPINAVYNNLPSWTNNDVGSSGDNLKQRADSITQKFNNSTGHAHDGSAGNGAPIPSDNIANVALLQYLLLAMDITAAGVDDDVTAQFSGQTPSTSSTIEGPITITPFNKVIITGTSGSDSDQPLTDLAGNIIYGRVTESSGTWTLTYYSEVSGVETSYNFTTPTLIHWYYNALFNPIKTSSSPVYNYTSLVTSGGGGGGSLAGSMRSGEVSVSIGSVSVSVSFSTPLSSSSYSLSTQFVNTFDVFPQFQPVTITTKNASGFTAAWNGGLETANYNLDYQAIVYV